MISFLQKVLQKHHKWLFSILLLIVTISFVFTVGSSPGIGRSGQKQEKIFFGHDLSSQKNIIQLLREVELSAQLQQIFIGTEPLQNYALFSRLAALKLANDFGIPKPDKNSLNRFIETYPIFRGDNQQFDTHKYNDFLEQVSKDSSQLGMFERTIANDFKIAMVERLLFSQGYALDSQAQSAIIREMTKYFFGTAKFNALSMANDFLEYEPQKYFEVHSENEFREYFEAHQNAYRIGEQIVLDYIEFSSEFFAKKVPEPSHWDLRQIYKAHKNQFQNLTEGSKEWEAALTEFYEHNMADRLAMEAATQFIYDLYDKNIARDSESFKQLVAEGTLKISHLDPLILGQFSENEYFSDESLAQASKLNEDRYFSDPVRAKNGNTCVLLYQDCIPPIDPPLDSVRERVVQDFLAAKKEEKFAQRVGEIQKILAEAQPLSLEVFAKIVAEHGGTTTQVVGKNLREGITPQEQEILLSLRAGTISNAIFTEKMEAEIVFLEKKETPSDIDSTTIAQTVAALEGKNKESFSDYMIEMILDEMHITNGREDLLQHYKMMASLIHMQRHRHEFGF
jgi:peptidyl-prolyl cis-trans isomerase D